MAADAEIIDIHCGWGASAAAPEWGDAGRLRDALRARGVGTAFLAADLGRRFDFVEGNAEVADVIARFPELRGWLVLHPARMADANAQMRRYLYGERFVGCALYPDPLTGKPVTLRAALELINMFRRFAKPLLVQADTAAAMEEVAAIAQEMTGMRVIASGMGGDDWREAVDLAVRPLNLYLDISGALVPEKIEYAISSLNGVRKLVFGSGAPRTDPAALLGLLDDLSLNPDDRARLLHLNATRLFALDRGADEETDALRPMRVPESTEIAADSPGMGLLTPDE
jgi:hypothetical protein